MEFNSGFKGLSIVWLMKRYSTEGAYCLLKVVAALSSANIHLPDYMISLYKGLNQYVILKKSNTVSNS